MRRGVLTSARRRWAALVVVIGCAVALITGAFDLVYTLATPTPADACTWCGRDECFLGPEGWWNCDATGPSCRFWERCGLGPIDVA